jgi:hypothetical protein
MNNGFQDEYRSLFTHLGYRLTEKEGFDEARIGSAESKLGVQLPQALRDYYLVAGRERRLNHSFNRFCSLDDLEIHSGKLIFLVENQAVVLWGVTVGPDAGDDPAVFQAPLTKGRPNRWYAEHDCCSKFLKFMIHLQAAYGGGLPCTASAAISLDSRNLLEKDWTFGGEVNGMRTYSRERQVVCVVEWPDLGGKQKSWRAFAGGLTQKDLEEVAVNLSLQWD